jgi:guanine deaminase
MNTSSGITAAPADPAAARSGWQLVRGDVLHFLGDPGSAPDGSGAVGGQNGPSYEYHADGGLLIEDGRVRFCGAWVQAAAAAPPDAQHIDHRGKLICPGFVDTHVHYPQTDIIASPGHGLLDWLDRYALPAERRFADEALAREVAEFFCAELLRNGTTSALVFGTVHPQSVDAFMGVAQARNLRMVAGKVMMDRNCPDTLRDTALSSYEDSKRLIERWHGLDRLRYAITPRFAATSSDQQLEAAGALAREYPDVPVHSHVAENTAEVELIRALFPWSRSYLDVYEHFGLLKPHSVYAHGIYLDAQDRHRMAEHDTAIAFCPTSNLFLGSGLLDLRQALDEGVRVGVATDVGGGTSFSMLRTLGAAYQVAHLKGYVLPALRAFYLATLAGARALGLAQAIGNFAPGKEADFIVLDAAATPLLARRMASAQSLEERLFLWLTLGDDRAIEASYIMGTRMWQRPEPVAGALHLSGT